VQTAQETQRYLASCGSPFWQRVFAAELEYLLQYLKPADDILSVGCGPATIESRLAAMGFRVTGLDVSREALSCAPDAIRTVAGSAEEMPFAEASFDVVVYIASLQFVTNYQQALARTAQVLRPDGRVIALLLNPDSCFFKERHADTGSYVRNLKHADLQAIERAMMQFFDVRGEYALGLAGDTIIDRQTADTAALYVLHGTVKVLT
jgi:ubiquinone/menaquinone biosynthesis C-methylase UbiE